MHILTATFQRESIINRMIISFFASLLLSLIFLFPLRAEAQQGESKSQPSPWRVRIIAIQPPPSISSRPSQSDQLSKSSISNQSRPVRRLKTSRHTSYKGPLWSSMRVGGLIHDVGILGGSKEQGFNLNIEINFRRLAFMRMVGGPMPSFGASVNTAGDTSQYYGGLLWQWNNISETRFFLSGFFGLAYHNGKKELPLGSPVKRKELGSRILFREAVDIGYRLNDRHAIGLYVSHISNANTAPFNEGLDNAGLRYAYFF